MATTPSEADVAARLIERLLADPGFRARFRRDPAGACREAGLEQLAQEMSLGGGKAFHTLDIRESKSSLAGVMMAAAMEGIVVGQFVENVLPQLEQIPGEISDVVSRIDLPAISLPGGGGNGEAVKASAPAADPPAAAPEAGQDLPASGDVPGVAAAPDVPGVAPPSAAGGTAPAPAAPAVPPPATPAPPAETPKAETPPAAEPKEPKEPTNDAAKDAAKKIAEQNSPEAEQRAAEQEAANDLENQTTGLPGSDDLPTGEAPPAPAPGTAPPAQSESIPGTPGTPAPDPTVQPGDAPAPDASLAPGGPAKGALPASGPAGAPAPPPELAGKAAAASKPEQSEGLAKRIARRISGGGSKSGGNGGARTFSGSPAGKGEAPAADNSLPAAAPDNALPTEASPELESTEVKPGKADKVAAVAEQVSTPKQRPPIDPAQYGGEGTGGPPDPEALALLKNKNIVLDKDGIADIKAGRIDPRVVGVLTKLSQEHKITVSCMCSDHSKFTAGGSVSNHHHGRGVDIAAIDGEIVSPGSPLAREIASEVSTLNPDIRPNEIGSPFAIAGPGYFTDGAHQNHIHLGFKEAIPSDWKPPADVAADGSAPAPAAAAAAAPAQVAAAPVAAAPVAAAPVAPVQPAVAAAPPEPKLDPRKSDAFLQAVKASAASSRGPERGDSQAFLQAVQKKPAAQAAQLTGQPAAGAPVAGVAEVAATAPGAYPGNDAPKEQLAAWMAAEAQKRGLPPELPVMAALVESGLKNLNYGDADSVGFFQMRVSIWDQGPYKGYADKPELQIKWFLDEASKIKAQRVAAGKPIDDPNSFGEWIADTERPAEQYRGRYQTKLAEAQGLVKSGAAAPAAPAAPVEPQPVAAAQQPAAPAAPVDPKQFGGDEVGTGGAASPEALAALNNPNLVFDDVGKADIKAGRIDPRVIGVLTKLSQEHKIAVSCMCSDHSKFTAGGSISNHFFGRGVDIASIDGEIVGPGSPLAREIASEVSTLDPNIRPNEIGSPFAIGGPGYFTDAAHQNHIHLGFKQEITPDWRPPADVAATGQPGAPAQFAAATPGAPVAAAAAAPPEPKLDPRKSNAFLQAVKASAASGRPVEKGDSQAFLQAVEPKPAGQAAAAAAPVQPAAPAGQPAAAAPVADVSAAVASAPDAYPGDEAPKEQIAAWMAAEAQKRGLPPQLPIMAGLVESGLKNLNFGHADSVGFFQMRVGIWNQGAYAGYPDKPELQMKWFLDQAEAVKKQRLVAGKPIDDPNQFGEWIADVERPAEQFRGRYQTKLAEANQLLNAQPQQPAAAQPVSAPVDPAAAAAVVGNAQLPAEIAAPLQQAIASGNGPGPKALAAITEASKHMGTAYKWGGSTPQTGFDCSGLMQWSYAQSGVQIPRVTYTQIEAPNGTEIADRNALKPGDLVFFSANGDVHHVGMFLGGDKFLHAPSTGDVVKVSSLSEPYYAGQFAGGRRFDNAAPAAVAAPAAQPAQFAAAQPAAIDPTEVAKAQAAVARDAAEVRRNDSQLFMAVARAEASKAAAEEKHASQMFLKAVDPSQVEKRRSLAAEPPAVPASPPPAGAPPAAAPPVAPAQPVAATPAAAPPPEVAPAQPDAVAAASIDLTNAASEYPGDNASQEQLSKWLAKQAEAAGLPPELPVMAALVESGVKNLNFGDRDSVGFFQMRTGIWNQGAYKGYPEKPELQAKWFIDTALAVKRKAIARGDAGFGKDPAKWGEWIADTERPAEQFRGRYQLRLGEARKLLA